MVFRRGRRGLGNKINSTKNIVDVSGIIAASTNTKLATLAQTVESAALATTNEVDKGCSIYSIFLSMYQIAEGGEVANEVPLMDWYIIKDDANNMGTTFDASHLPTPGATGVHENKRYIFHTEKGLTGGGDISLAGLPMIFKGVIKIPRGMQTFRMGDTLKICARTNFATKHCISCIYKYYR